MREAIANDAIQHARQQAMLVAFAEFAMLHDELENISSEACRCVCLAVDADIVLLHRIDESEQAVLITAAAGVPTTAIGSRIPFRDRSSLESRALRDGEPILVTDVREEARLETRDLLLSHGQHGLALLPLVDGAGKPPLGLLHISTRAPRDFSPHLPFLRIYVSLVATSMMRIRALEERRALRMARERSDRHLRIVLEGIPQLVWTAGPPGYWTWAGPQWKTVTGLGTEESKGVGWLRAIHPEDREAVDAAWDAAESLNMFEVECRIWSIKDARYHWHQGRAVSTPDRGQDLVWLGTFTDIEELRTLEARQAVLVAELQHRTRNLIAVIEGIALRTIDASSSFDDFSDSFHERLQALARAQQLLSGSDEIPVTMRSLVETELEAMGVDQSARGIVVFGPDTTLPRIMVQTLALVLHELATNARKYGVLQNDVGTLRIEWKIVKNDVTEFLDFLWTETRPDDGTDRVISRSGFGRELIENALPFQLNAKSEYAITSSSVRCNLLVPLPGRSMAHSCASRPAGTEPQR